MSVRAVDIRDFQFSFPILWRVERCWRSRNFPRFRMRSLGMRQRGQGHPPLLRIEANMIL